MSPVSGAIGRLPIGCVSIAIVMAIIGDDVPPVS